MFVHVHQRDALRMGHTSNVPVICDLSANLNTPPHSDYSSLHGIGLAQAKKVPEVSELFNIQGFCEHVSNIFMSIDISEMQISGLYMFM